MAAVKVEECRISAGTVETLVDSHRGRSRVTRMEPGQTAVPIEPFLLSNLPAYLPEHLQKNH